MKSPKLILPLIAAMLLSIGIISYVSAEETTPYLQKLFSVFGITENSDAVKISVYDNESEDFANSMEISPNKISVSGELCLNDTCTKSFLQSQGNNLYHSTGGIGIGTEKEEKTSFVTIQNKPIAGIGTVDIGTTDFANLDLSPSAQNPADLAGISTGDSITLYIDNLSVEGKVTATPGNKIKVIINNSQYNLTNNNTLTDIPWAITPQKIMSIKNSMGEEILTILEDGIILGAYVGISGHVAMSGDLRLNDVWITRLGKGFWVSDAFNYPGDLPTPSPSSDSGDLAYLQCLDVKGVPVNEDGEDIDGKTTGKLISDYYFCKISASMCPAGWDKHENWSTTSVANCMLSGKDGCAETKCSTSSHSWSNTATESCSLKQRYLAGFRGCTLTSDDKKTCFADINEVGCKKTTQ